jgi:hypothetical protein
MNSYLKRAFGLSLAGTLFAGYLSFYKIFAKACAFNEPCPTFWGYPACWYGLGMFGLMFLVSSLGLSKRLPEPRVARMNFSISFLGTLFAGYFTWGEIARWIGGAGVRYSLGLPTCAYGLIFYVIIFVLSLKRLRTRSVPASSSPAAAPPAA